MPTGSQNRNASPDRVLVVRALSEHLQKNAQRRDLLKDCEACHILDITPFLEVSPGKARLAENGVIFYCDDDHLSIEGARQLAPHLLDAIENVLTNRRL